MPRAIVSVYLSDSEYVNYLEKMQEVNKKARQTIIKELENKPRQK